MTVGIFCAVALLLAGNLPFYRRVSRFYPMVAPVSILLGFAGVLFVRACLAQELRDMQGIYIEIMGLQTAESFFKTFARFEIGTAVYVVLVSVFSGWVLIQSGHAQRPRRVVEAVTVASMALMPVAGVVYSLFHLSKAFHFSRYLLCAAACRMLFLLLPIVFCWAAQAQIRRIRLLRW